MTFLGAARLPSGMIKNYPPVWLLSIPLLTSVHNCNVSCGGGRLSSHVYGWASCGNGAPTDIVAVCFLAIRGDEVLVFIAGVSRVVVD